MLVYKKVLSSAELDNEFSDISEKVLKLELPKGFSDFVSYSISELFANIKEHSKAKKAAVYIKIDRRNCAIKISDNGLGLRKSYLSKKIYPKDDFSAIEFALGGLSTKSQERGFGIYSIKRLVEELNGSLVLKTGKASVIIHKNKTASAHNKTYIKGLTVDILVPVKRIDFYKFIS